MPNIGAFLARVREDYKVSIKAVASAADFDRSYISRVESGERVVTNKIIDAYVQETGCAILSMLKEHDLLVVIAEYVKSRQMDELMNVMHEMQKLPISLAAIAGVL